MMDNTQRAREVAKKIIKLADNCKGIADCLDMMEEQIGEALAQARREGLEEAAKLECFCCARPTNFTPAEERDGRFYHRKSADGEHVWECTAAGIQRAIRERARG